jgi:uncharacterized protein
MKTQPFYVLEAVDVRRADEPDSSRALTINTVVLPALKAMSADHTPGGGVGGVKVSFPSIEALEPKFKLAGMDLDIASSMGFRVGSKDRWVFAAAMRDKQTGRVLPVRALLQGSITGWEPDEAGPGTIAGCDHTMTDVVLYELKVDGTEIFHWDWFSRIYRHGGLDLMGDVRQALGA